MGTDCGSDSAVQLFQPRLMKQRQTISTGTQEGSQDMVGKVTTPTAIGAISSGSGACPLSLRKPTCLHPSF